MNHDKSHLNKRATPKSSFIILLIILLCAQLSIFYKDNRKLLTRMQKMTHEPKEAILEHNSIAISSSGNGPLNNSTISNSSTPNRHAILMIHYHKTGFVLSRLLRSHAITHFTHYISRGAMNPSLNFTLPPPDKSWGSIQQPRKFTSSYCPNPFDLQRGTIHVQESPDFYCPVNEMGKILLNDEAISCGESKREGTKIIHFVRNPYSMALSNYYYHAQVPTPEPWVTHHNPCKINYINDTTTLKDVLFPTLSDRSILSQDAFDKVVNLCKSLYQTKPHLRDGKFKQHLHQLDPIDGLKLSTAQMMIRGGGVVLMPGGDLLRMANNIIKFEQLRAYTETNHETYKPLAVEALSMDDFITDPLKFTQSYLKILTGSTVNLFRDNPTKSGRVMGSIAKRFAQKYTKNQEDEKHVTAGKHEDKEELLESLKQDEILGPILDAIESLVNDALKK